MYSTRSKYFFLLLVAVFSLSACGGGGGSTTAPVESRVALSGTVQAPGGTVSTDNSSGLQPVAGAEVKLYKIDDSGAIIEGPLESTTASPSGLYRIELPSGVVLSSDLIVRAFINETESVSALVVAEEVNINPISQFVLDKLVSDPTLVMKSLPIAEVVSLINFIESLEIGPAADLSAMLARIESIAGTSVDATIASVGDPSSRVTLSGVLIAPGPAGRLGNRATVQRLVSGTTVFLYRIDNAGNIIGEALGSTITSSTGAYKLVLPEGEVLSSNLILRAAINDTETLTALVVAEAMDIDANSQYVYDRILADEDIVLDSLSVADVLDLIGYIQTLSLTEQPDLGSMISFIDEQAGGGIDIRIDTIKTNAATTLGVWGSASWGLAQYQ